MRSTHHRRRARHRHRRNRRRARVRIIIGMNKKDHHASYGGGHDNRGFGGEFSSEPPPPSYASATSYSSAFSQSSAPQEPTNFGTRAEPSSTQSGHFGPTHFGPGSNTSSAEPGHYGPHGSVHYSSSSGIVQNNFVHPTATVVGQPARGAMSNYTANSPNVTVVAARTGQTYSSGAARAGSYTVFCCFCGFFIVTFVVVIVVMIVIFVKVIP